MIAFFRNTLILLWRVWFYLLFLVSVLLLSPVLLITTSKESWYGIFFRIAKLWAMAMLFLTGFSVVRLNRLKLPKDKSYVFIANHTSILDVFLMLVLIDNPFVFVGKKELVKIPIFGFFYKKTCILVDRSDVKSKQLVFKAAQHKINMGLSICIFPEGLVPDDESIVVADFKKGAFKLAIEHSLPIVPLSFYDCKKRFSYTFFSGKPGKLRVKFHKVYAIKGKKLSELNAIRKEFYNFYYEDLTKF